MKLKKRSAERYIVTAKLQSDQVIVTVTRVFDNAIITENIPFALFDAISGLNDEIKPEQTSEEHLELEDESEEITDETNETLDSEVKHHD